MLTCLVLKKRRVVPVSVEVNDGRQRESCEMAEETDAAEGGATIPFAEELDLELKKNFVL